MTCLLLAAISVVGSFATQASAPSAEFVRMEMIWNDAHKNGDATALERLWDDDLEVAVPRMPVMSKQDVLAVARSGRMRFERYETSDIKVREYGETAVVTGRLQRTRLLGEQRVDDDWRFTKVYTKRNGVWRVVAFHASDAGH